MMPSNLYCTVDEIRAETGVTDEIEDARIEIAIEAMSRQIDTFTYRRFYATTETRYYTPLHYDELYIDDCTAITALKTDDDADRTYGTTWQSTDYDLTPYNALLNDEPYTSIKTTPNGNYSFPVGVARGVSVAGDFGYVASTASAPAAIKAATVLGTVRLLARFDSPLGVTASTVVRELTTVVSALKLDPDFMGMIMPLRRVV